MEQIAGVPGGSRLIGADLPFSGEAREARNLLAAFRAALSAMPDLRLALAGQRDRSLKGSIWHVVEDLGLTGQVELYPYYDRLRAFPRFKDQCAYWVERRGDDMPISTRELLDGVSARPTAPRFALFVTMVHPGLHAGNARLMRMWLDHLRDAGCRRHVLYYSYDRAQVGRGIRAQARNDYEIYQEVAVRSPLVGRNRPGSNLDVDDWTGPEFLDAVDQLVASFAYDYAVVNYAFCSATFERMNAYTRKILLTHDVFADRNRRMIEQGFERSSWMSIPPAGERKAAARADMVVAIQKDEQDLLADLCSSETDLRLVSPVLPYRPVVPVARGPRLRIGFFGSGNAINQRNLADYVGAILDRPGLSDRIELLLAGGLCRNVDRYVVQADLERVSAHLLGEIDELPDFFSQCDLVVNPERGGTGIKIKTLETMAFGMPLLSTVAGAVGFDSASEFHNAASAAELADLTQRIVEDDALLEAVRRQTREAYFAYRATHLAGLERIVPL